MWPFKDDKTPEQKQEDAFRGLSELVAYATARHHPYDALDVIVPLIELYNSSELSKDSEGRLKIKGLIDQFVFNCEFDGWIKHQTYSKAKEFLKDK